MAIGSIKEILENMENGVYDFTKDGECVGCGNCCSNLLPLSNMEIIEIKQYIKKHNIKERKHIAPTANPTLDLTCPFLMDEKSKDKCAIYPVRPKICRVFCCNQPPSKVQENKALFWESRKCCDMRQLFFGNEKG